MTNHTTKPTHYSSTHKWGARLLALIAGLVLAFLMLPLLIVVPLSFNAEPFFSFTSGMLKLDAQAYSLRWYRSLLDSSNWLLAIRNSFTIGITASLRSEEHTSELQSRGHLVCRLLLEQKK